MNKKFINRDILIPRNMNRRTLGCLWLMNWTVGL